MFIASESFGLILMRPHSPRVSTFNSSVPFVVRPMTSVVSWLINARISPEIEESNAFGAICSNAPSHSSVSVLNTAKYPSMIGFPSASLVLKFSVFAKKNLLSASVLKLMTSLFIVLPPTESTSSDLRTCQPVYSFQVPSIRPGLLSAAN